MSYHSDCGSDSKNNMEFYLLYFILHVVIALDESNMLINIPLLVFVSSCLNPGDTAAKVPKFSHIANGCSMIWHCLKNLALVLKFIRLDLIKVDPFCILVPSLWMITGSAVPCQILAKPYSCKREQTWSMHRLFYHAHKIETIWVSSVGRGVHGSAKLRWIWSGST